MMFTLTDKTLLDRAARMINAAAKELRLQYEAAGWASTEAGRKAKQEYDRLLRDERDMRALGKRLCLHFEVKAAPRVMEAAGTLLAGDKLVARPADGDVSHLPAGTIGADLVMAQGTAPEVLRDLKDTYGAPVAEVTHG
jgi:hypothetical protein